MDPRWMWVGDGNVLELRVPSPSGELTARAMKSLRGRVPREVTHWKTTIYIPTRDVGITIEDKYHESQNEALRWCEHRLLGFGPKEAEPEVPLRPKKSVWAHLKDGDD